MIMVMITMMELQPCFNNPEVAARASIWKDWFDWIKWKRSSIIYSRKSTIKITWFESWASSASSTKAFSCRTNSFSYCRTCVHSYSSKWTNSRLPPCAELTTTKCEWACPWHLWCDVLLLLVCKPQDSVGRVVPCQQPANPSNTTNHEWFRQACWHRQAVRWHSH